MLRAGRRRAARAWPAGPFSLALHRNLILALEHQRFPDKTPNEPDRWQWVHCEVTAGRRGPGLRHRHPRRRRRGRAGRDREPQVEPDHPRPDRQVLGPGRAGRHPPGGQPTARGRSSSPCSWSATSTRSGRPARGKVEVPVALVFTKADLCEDAIHDPDAFARANAPGLWRICESRLKHFRFYLLGRRRLDRASWSTATAARPWSRSASSPAASSSRSPG